MRLIYVLTITLFMMCQFFGCEENTNPAGAMSTDYSKDTVVVDYKNANNVVYYDLSEDAEKSVEHDSWHLAFDDKGYLIANSGDYGYGVLVCSTGIDDISLDLSSWKDSLDESKENGNFRLVTEESNLLGQSYKSESVYTGEVYILVTETGRFFKFQVTGGVPDIQGLIMRTDSLKGSGGLVDTFLVQDGYGYTYVDLNTRSTVDVAPPVDEWDLRFGRTGDYIMSNLWSGRSSIGLNKKGGVEAGIAEGVLLGEVMDPKEYDYSDEILTIGHEWYEHEMGDNGHVYYTLDNVYLIKTTEGRYAKMKMLTFKGPEGESYWSIFKYHYQEDGSEMFER